MRKVYPLLAFLFFFLIFAYADEYTIDTKKVDFNGKTNLIINSLPKYANSNGDLLKDQKSLLDCDFCDKLKINVKLDKKYDVEILDFNLTSIKLSVKASESDKKKLIPIESKNKYNKDVKYKEAYVFVNNENERVNVTLPFGFDNEIKYGFNSTSITLDVDSGTESYDVVDSITYGFINKWNLTSVSDKNIESVIFYQYLDTQSGSNDNDILFKRFSNQTWDDSMSKFVLRNMNMDGFNITLSVSDMYVSTYKQFNLTSLWEEESGDYFSFYVYDPDYVPSFLVESSSSIFYTGHAANGFFQWDQKDSGTFDPYLNVTYSSVTANLTIINPTSDKVVNVTNGEVFEVNMTIYDGGQNVTQGIDFKNATLNGTLVLPQYHIVNEKTDNTLIFFDGFEDDVEWTEWTESGTGNMLIDPDGFACAGDDNIDFYGNYGMCLDNCEVHSDGCVLDLDDEIDLSDCSDAQLNVNFWIESNWDTNIDYFDILVRNGSDAWTQIYLCNPGSCDNNAWTNFTYNISSGIGLVEKFDIKLHSNVTGGAEEMYLDDIQVICDQDLDVNRTQFAYLDGNWKLNLTAPDLSSGKYDLNVSFNVSVGDLYDVSLQSIQYISGECSESIINSSWINTLNSSCIIIDFYNSTWELIEYDVNQCSGGHSNITYTKYNQSWSCNYCSYDVINTSWTNWLNITACQVNDTTIKERNRTSYDQNYSICYDVTGLASDLWNSGNNITYNEYGDDDCDYCTPDLVNTSWLNVLNTTCHINDYLNSTWNLTEYDQNYCDEVFNTSYSIVNQTFVCDYCQYNIVNTSWTSWFNESSCVSDGINQSRNRTEYDDNYSTCYDVTGLASDLWNSGLNNTYWEWNNLSCVGCTESIVNTTWSSWFNISGQECSEADEIYQNRTRIEYDENYCGSYTNLTYYETQYGVCDYCTPLVINTTWSVWLNISCDITNQTNQSRNLTSYDNNSCYSLTLLPSDLFTNITYYEYQLNGICSYNGTYSSTGGGGGGSITLEEYEELSWYRQLGILIGNYPFMSAGIILLLVVANSDIKNRRKKKKKKVKYKYYSYILLFMLIPFVKAEVVNVIEYNNFTDGTINGSFYLTDTKIYQIYNPQTFYDSASLTLSLGSAEITEDIESYDQDGYDYFNISVNTSFDYIELRYNYYTNERTNPTTTYVWFYNETKADYTQLGEFQSVICTAQGGCYVEDYGFLLLNTTDTGDILKLKRTASSLQDYWFNFRGYQYYSYTNPENLALYLNNQLVYNSFDITPYSYNIDITTQINTEISLTNENINLTIQANGSSGNISYSDLSFLYYPDIGVGATTGGIPTFDTFIDILKGGASLPQILKAYNPPVYDLLLEQYKKTFNFNNFNNLLSNVIELLRLHLKYILREPATLVPYPI